MSAHEDLNKAYTAGVTQTGTNWAGAAGADTFRGANQMGAVAGDAEIHLTDAQRKYLLDRVINQATLLGMVRKYAMDRSAVAIPRMSLGTRVARASTAGGHLESTTMGTRVAPDFENIELKSSRIVLPWTISEEFLQDNPEKDAAEGIIAGMMGDQLANDLEDLAVNEVDRLFGEALERAFKKVLQAVGGDLYAHVLQLLGHLDHRRRGMDAVSLRRIDGLVHRAVEITPGERVAIQRERLKVREERPSESVEQPSDDRLPLVGVLCECNAG